MRKIFLILILFLFFSINVFADNRVTTTTTTYNATTLTATLVKTGDARIYSINFVASSAGGLYVIMDAVTNTTATGSFADIKTEGKEATSLNSHFKSFAVKPLEFSTGLMIVVQNGTLIISYD